MEQRLTPYRVGASIVLVDETATKGALVIDYTLKDGTLDKAYRVVTDAELKLAVATRALEAICELMNEPGLRPVSGRMHEIADVARREILS